MSDRLEVAITLQVPGFDLDVTWSAGGGVAVLFGPSGAGKTLTLSCLAGLITPAAGRIVVDGRVFFDSAAGINLPAQARRVGYVFQGYALFPHLTVADNLGFLVTVEEVPAGADATTPEKH
jgi:molybdate transport system ATP-binding protein